MVDEAPGLSPPFVSHRTLLTQIERMESEGVPSKIDMHFLKQMAGGTQNHFRQALRSLGLIGEDARPTQLLYELVEARQGARAQLFAKIMTDRFPALYQLPPNASKSDFFAVLDSYGVKSADQQRKILTFFVATADAAGMAVSTHIRPTKSHTGPRKPRNGRPRRAASRNPAENAESAAHAEGSSSANGALAPEVMRSRYFTLLLKKAEQENADGELLNRIERLVGITGDDTDQNKD
jgi:Family of unknown function (DUF5343)